MSRSRIALLGVALIALVAVVTSVSADDVSVASLSQKIDQLEKRIAVLEQQVARNSAAAAQPAQPSATLETEATAAYRDINNLVAQNNYTEAKAKMSDFMQKYGSTNIGRQAARLNAELQVVGKPAPAKWGIESWFQGESEVDLASDKTTLLVFWEVWCPHCKREVPKLQELYSSLHDEGLQVVGLTKITKSATEAGVRDFVTQQSVKYPVAKEDGSLSAYFGVSGIPAAAVLKGGKVIWRGHPARLSESVLKSWL